MTIRKFAAGICCVAVAGFLSSGCKDSNPSGDDNTPLPCNHVYDSLVLIANAQYGFAPMGPAVPLDSLGKRDAQQIQKLVITNSMVQPIGTGIPAYEYSGRPHSALGKIVFKSAQQ